MIYADNAATTKLDAGAFEVMFPFLMEEYGNASQPYSFSRSAKKALLEAREIIASCINANPEEIYFTSGGTESDNWAIKGTVAFGDHRSIITTQIEHHAVLNACAAVERFGFPVAYLSVDHTGIVSPEKLKTTITKNTKMVSIMTANNEIGTVEPIAELCDLAHMYGAIFHTDAVQAVGHIPIDVKDAGIDMLSASGHKFNAPKGVGFLYIKNGTSIIPHSDGGSQEFGLRAGTENVASIVAMAYALKKNCTEMGETAKKLRRMECEFLGVLSDADLDYTRNGADYRIPGNISISIKNISGETLLHRLDLKGIYISTGSACDGSKNQISHVIKAIAVPEDYAKGTIRISFGANNLESDARDVANAIIDVVNKM